MASNLSETMTPVPHAARTGFVNVQHAGVVTGLVLGGWHVLWSAIVASGWAQSLVDFVFWMHFIKPVYVVEQFEPMRALILIAVTALIGYVIGSVFAFVWNHFHR